MPHLGSFRKGWENENLARFILYKFSFLAQPFTISDDIGSDFYCTLFQIQEENGHEYLIPKSAFAIQIKSNPQNLDVSNKLQYLESLEIPFFVGVVDRQDLKLTIYSAEYLPAFFSHKGVPKHLEFELCTRDKLRNLDDYIVEVKNEHYILRFPKITEIRVDDEGEELKTKVQLLHKFCILMQENISSRISREYLYKIPRHDLKTAYITIFAGRDSTEVFRENFFKRLSEVFYNLEWIYQHNSKLDWREFFIYKNLFYELKSLYGELPEYLTGSFESLSNILKRQQ